MDNKSTYPRVWDTLTGQSHVVSMLDQPSTYISPSHAWLFTGPPGSGRSNAARALSAALECTNSDPTNKGCGNCTACRLVMSDRHPDVKVFNTDKVIISIDETRDLITQSYHAPSQGKWRIIIVEDADRMQERTSNVLLKSLEEPPERTIWMLCAPSFQDILPTIRSRCRLVALKVPDTQDVASLLTEQENITPSLAYEAASLSQGHIGVAKRLASDEQARNRREQIVSLTNQLRGVGDSFSIAKKMLELSQEENEAMTNERNSSEKQQLLQSLGYGPKERLKPNDRAYIKDLEDNQKRRTTRTKRDTLDRFLIDIQSLYRDVLLVQLKKQSSSVESAQFINAHMAEHIKHIAATSKPEDSLFKIDAITQARNYIDANVDPALALEAMTVKLL